MNDDKPVVDSGEDIEQNENYQVQDTNEVDNFYKYDEENEENEEGQQEEEYEEIDYNKEKVKIPKSKVKELLQKGYHAETGKLYEQRDEYKNKLEEIERKTGLNYEKIIAQQEEQQLNQEAEKLIEQYGIDEALAQEMARQRKELNDIKSRNAITEMNNQNKSEMEGWEKKEPAIFGAIKEKVFETMQAHNVNFNVAYQHIKGSMTFEELSNIYNSNNNNARVNNEYDNRRRGGVVSSGDGTSGRDYTSEIRDPDVLAAAKYFGLDLNKVGKHIAKK